MAGIIEPDAGPVVLGGLGIKCHCLGALHVGMKPAEPEQAGTAARAGANRNLSLKPAMADRNIGRRQIEDIVLCHAVPVSALIPAMEVPAIEGRSMGGGLPDVTPHGGRLRNPNARSMWAVLKNISVLPGLFSVTKMPRI